VILSLLVSEVNSNSKTITSDEYFQNFCREILKRHYFIRSAAIVDHVGHLMATACRHGLTSLMTQEESSRAATQAAIRAATRNKFKSKNYNSHGHFKPITSERYLTDVQEYIFHFTKTENVKIDKLAIGVKYQDQHSQMEICDRG
jgi:hypothetical protein